MLKKPFLFIKNHLWQLSTFLLGTIVVILLTKAFDGIFPDEPIIIKEVADTLKIVHRYELPETPNNDSIDLLLQKKMNQISQLNLYEEELDNYYKKIKAKKDNSVNDIPNRIILDQSKRLTAKGYTEGNATAFFESECPEITNQKYLNFKFDFLSSELITEIYCLRLCIYKTLKNKYNQSYFDDFYEVRQKDNYIRILNDLPAGNYELQYGIMLKRDVKKEYPPFFMKKCYITIN